MVDLDASLPQQQSSPQDAYSGSCDSQNTYVRVDIALPNYVVDFTSDRRNVACGLRVDVSAQEVLQFALRLMYGVASVDDL